MTPDDHTASAIEALERRLAALESEKRDLLAELARLRHVAPAPEPAATQSAIAPAVSSTSDAAAKIKLFKSLFRGRDDVFPRRWQNAKTGKSGYSPVCRNEWVRGVCEKPRVKCGECPNQAFVPVTDDVIRCHLQGTDRDVSSRQSSEYIAGVYPLLPDEKCWFLAIDFDKQSWQIDARAFLDACRAHDIDAGLERSRSGQGAHVWIFFAEAVPAADARKLGSMLVTSAMERRPDIGFESYDRFFPSQDTRPSGGFGNLIALPFQEGPRRLGNSVFVDDEWVPYADQWAFLSSLKRVAHTEVVSLVSAASAAGRIVGVRFPVDDDDSDEPWRLPPSRRPADQHIRDKTLPECVKVVLGNQIFIDRSALPAPLVARCIRLAAFQNPEFYAAQAMRLPTFGKPRVISCAALFPRHVALPRGCLDALLELLNEHHIRPDIQDERESGTPLAVTFLGQLTDEQGEAATALLQHDHGVLAAATAFGKTVVASRVIAARARNTLVLVHRRQIMEQWVAKLSAFLDIDAKCVGIIGGGKKKPTGHIDVALIQSLVRKGEVSDVVASYGHLIVDECHHLPAVSFEAVARQSKAKYVLGLSATVTRKDGHHPIVFMQCGPVRHKVDARRQASVRPFAHKVVFRQTAFRAEPSTESPSRIQALYGLLAKDEARNDLIFNDVLLALEAGRSPVILTERKDHLLYLSTRLSKFAKNVIVFHGGMKANAQKEAERALKEVLDSEERVLLATGRYLGEGFDDARLDTLFLTMPISWRGLLSQYAGRLHRLHPTKRDVMIYDYVDAHEAMLRSMSVKRRAGYRSLGYTEVSAEETPSKT